MIIGGKLRWRPEKSPVLIFDAEAASVLRRTVLPGIPHTILPTRREAYYVAPEIAARMLGNLGKIDWSFVRARLRAGSIRGVLSQFFKIYLLSCVQSIEPKVVLTMTDNDWLFQAVSRLYPQAEFYAIQNGSRSVGCVTGTLPRPPHPGSVISMPNFFCFGRYEADLYREHGHTIDAYHQAGAIMGGYYRSRVPPGRKPDFDLCLVSQWRDIFMTDPKSAEIKRSLLTLDEHLSRYVRETRLKLAIALRGADPGEKPRFREVYGASAELLDNDFDKMTTYDAMDRSAVVVAFCSTCALEAFGWGKKVLFCNVYRHDESYSPPPGPWSVEEPSYEAFRAKLDALRAMGAEEYRSASETTARYAMAYDPARPAHVQIREKVEKALSR